MEMFNKVDLQGTIGSIREYTDEKTISFSLMTAEMYKDGDAVIVDQMWHNIQTTKDKIKCELEKGKAVHVLGKLMTKRYIGTDGVERQIVGVKATLVEDPI